TDGAAEIRAHSKNTIASALSSVLSNSEGVRINTIEHLMAAFAGAAVDNAVVELDGPEIPIMDGSAAPFLHLIEQAGTVAQDEPRRAIKIMKPVTVMEGAWAGSLVPGSRFTTRFEIYYEYP